MRIFTLTTLAAAMLAALLVGGASGATASPEIVSLDSLDTAIVARINVVRQAHSLRPLRASARLHHAADGHSRSMGTFGFFAHESRDGSAYWKRIKRDYPQGRYHFWSVGENLAFDSQEITAADVVTMWMGSPPHRRALLTATWREIGISALRVTHAPGIFEGDDVTIVTADFGARR